MHKILAASQQDKGFTRRYEIAVKFRELAYNYYTSQKQTAFYARSIGVSENYMNRCVKQVLGKSPKEILNEIAITQAQLMLRDLTKSVSQIAYALNFQDPSYFGRAFKQITGQTPSQYRDSIMHNLSG